MTRRRGLTLVEVLAAAALLSVIVAACIPLLRDAGAQAAQRGACVDLADLARLADQVLTDPAAFDLADLAEISDVRVSWPHAPARTPVQVRRLAIDDPGTGHTWLLFECGELAVSRWLPVAPSESEEDAP